MRLKKYRCRKEANSTPFPGHNLSNWRRGGQCGAAVCEYVIVLALVVGVAVPALQLIGSETSSVFVHVFDQPDGGGAGVAPQRDRSTGVPEVL